jgi:hypothetical protein
MYLVVLAEEVAVAKLLVYIIFAWVVPFAPFSKGRGIIDVI